MGKLIFRDDKKALDRLSKAQNAIDSFSKAHPGKLTKRQHSKFRGLLSERAAALSEATGMKIHSIFD